MAPLPVTQEEEETNNTEANAQVRATNIFPGGQHINSSIRPHVCFKEVDPGIGVDTS